VRTVSIALAALL